MSISLINSSNLSGQIKERSRQLGFDLVGICSADDSRYRSYLRQWLDDGRQGSMEYLARRLDERTSPTTYMPGAKSVICVACNYHAKLEDQSDIPGNAQGKIARYVLGDDYHELLKSRLYALADWIKEQVPDAQTRCAVDTAPVMEKELSARAGVGWLGKNTCIINERIGSWVLLGEVLTTLELPFDTPAIDRCGTCQQCIDACPTQAIVAPYQLDARKCISYLTIEHRSTIDPDLQPLMQDWLFGCDICQEVCPWNGRAPFSLDPAFQSRLPAGKLDVSAVQQWTSTDYQSAMRNSAIKRIKLPILQRNARIVTTNLAGG